MRPRHRLKTSLFFAVTAALVNGGCAANRLPELPPVQTIATVKAPKTPAVMLPEGAQVTTDPHPHPTQTYRAPQWDPRTAALAGLVTTATVQVMIAVSTAHMFGR